MDLGEVGSVWTPLAAALAFAAGFAFGLFVNSRRRTHLTAQASAWVVLNREGWFLGVLVLGQVVAGILDGDRSWPRIVSRFGLYLFGIAAAAFGTWTGLRLRRRRQSKEGP